METAAKDYCTRNASTTVLSPDMDVPGASSTISPGPMPRIQFKAESFGLMAPTVRF